MAPRDDRDSEPALSPRELAHQRARDRKRTTTMVVDNAGVKRILQARSSRAASRAASRKTMAGQATGGEKAGRPRSGG